MKYQRSPLMQQRLADNRERIMQATRELIAAGGFREVSIAAVARRVGLSTGAIYRYFSSKSELCVQALVDAVDHEIEILERAITAETTAAGQLRAAVESFTMRALKGPHLAYAFIAEPIDSEVEAGRIACRDRFGDVFKNVLRKGIVSGEFPDQSIDVAAACLVGAFTEALVRPVSTTAPPVDEQRLIRAISVFCLRAVASDRADTAIDTQ